MILKYMIIRCILNLKNKKLVSSLIFLRLQLMVVEYAGMVNNVNRFLKKQKYFYHNATMIQHKLLLITRVQFLNTNTLKRPRELK